MARFLGVISLFLLSGLLASQDPVKRAGLTPKLCSIPGTRVLHIPVTPLAVPDSPLPETSGTAANGLAALTISPGAADEPPEGPNGFDVMDDGSLLIVDPLRKRVAAYDKDSKFRKAWNIGFSADSLTVTANGMVLIREASTGQLHAFDREGQAGSAEGAVLPEQAEAQVVKGENRGSVRRSANGNSVGKSLEIQLDKPGLTLLSIESLAIDPKGDTYVALETTASGGLSDAITLNKYVRKYSSDGKLLGEIGDIPLDYYVVPVDELRVRKGVVYQLQTTKSEVRVNEWDANQACSHP